MKEKQLNLVNGQIIGIIFFIFCLIIILIISYNEKQKVLNNKTFLTDKETLDISLINRIILVILGIYFVYNSIERKKINANNSNLEILASILALSASLVILYIIIINYYNFEKNI